VNFLNVGPWELTVILIIAILLVGPRRMAELARQIGHTASQMRKLSSEFLGTIQTELEATEQETRQAMDVIAESGQKSIASIPDEVRAAEQDTRQVLETVSEERQAATTSIRDELRTIEHETRQAMEEISMSVRGHTTFEGIVKGEPEITGERVADSTKAKPEAEDRQDE
jgi:Sec-independent protein translocase protein TatA